MTSRSPSRSSSAPTSAELGFGEAGALSFFQFATLYATIAAVFNLAFRRGCRWRYVSIPDALVLARIALLTVGVFLLLVFVLDRAHRALPGPFMAPHLPGSRLDGVVRRALHEHALETFSPLRAITDGGPSRRPCC